MNSSECPGRDFSSVLNLQEISWNNEILYEAENLRCIRTEEWKYIHRFPDGPHELCHLNNAPWEKVNLYGQPLVLKKQDELKNKLDARFKKYANPEYDLWKGGRSKARLLVTRKNRLIEE